MDILSSAISYINKNFPKTAVLKKEPLKNHTSFRIGGCVPLLIIPDCTDAMCGIYAFFADRDITSLFLGNGTNILAEDCDFNFPVIKTHGGLKNIELTSDCTICADSGVSLSQLAVFALKNNLTGLEFAHGIPGTVGGAVYMNAGAYGGEIANVAVSTTALGSNGVYTISGNEHDFSYRHSVFSGTLDVILSSAFKLEHGNSSEISAKMEDLSAKRRASQPLDMPSAGSTFKRPVGGYAAAMIDECGLKGYTVGGAQVSEKHAGFVVNRGDATFSEVMAVIEHVKSEVYKKFGTQLETEVKIINREYRG